MYFTENVLLKQYLNFQKHKHSVANKHVQKM